MPRFVILEHDWPERHWDFMLEQRGVLQTWRLDSFPESDRWISAIPLPDHRLAYLDYEGPVSGNRGSVVRQESGTFEPSGSFAREIQLEVVGRQLVGTIRIIWRQNESHFLYQGRLRQGIDTNL